MIKKLFVIVAFLLAPFAAFSQTQNAPSDAERRFYYESQLGQLEEMAMCHHAIKAAHHDGLAFDQNPYFRYVLYAPRKGQTENVYPVPERCKSLETSLVLSYTKMGKDTKANIDKMLLDEVEMSISDLATDAEFLTVVINKIKLEGDKAVFIENKDKDIP